MALQLETLSHFQADELYARYKVIAPGGLNFKDKS